MSRIRYLIPIVMFAWSGASAIVIRNDVPDSKYLVPDNDFPALVDLPGEGHGVLISRRWVVTVAHAVRSEPVKRVTINGLAREVTQLIIHPDFRFPPEELLLLKGDAAPLMSAFAAMDDIALLRLAAPVNDVKPVRLYRGSNELGKLVKLYGKGVTGNGLSGENKDSPHRGKLRRAYNTIISADGKWLGYRFDSGAAALPLEGQLGNGDSGGPVLVQVDGAWQLAGLADRTYWSGDFAGYRRGIYGQLTYHVRISHYAAWIDSILNAER
jgi:hypothetical protein